MKLTFHGGAGSVTGANYLLEAAASDQLPATSGDAKKILIDCGLEQGSHYAERRNFESFPYDPKEIAAVFVTHAHLDHVGRLPKLVADGFTGTIYSTPPTRDSAELILLDSEHILRKEAEREAVSPFCTIENVKQTMRQWKGIHYHEPLDIGPFHVELYNAGHVLGSAIVHIEVNEGDTPPNLPYVRGGGAQNTSPPRVGGARGGTKKTIVFSGDLGNTPPPIITTTEQITSADYCVIEAVYGDRVHDETSARNDALEDVIEETFKAGGTLIVPAFAMERTQDLLYRLHQLFNEGRVPRVPVFIDSPLAIRLTEVYKKYENYFNADAKGVARSGDDILNFPGLRLTLTTEQSKDINNVTGPKIIMAGSGMMQGGRILHHALRYLPDPKSTILFVGYQAQGSLGRRIMEGATEVTIFGEHVPVRCRKVSLPAYSAHADQPRLLAWLKPMRQTLKKVFVVQGEEEACEVLAQKIRDEFAVDAEVPKEGESVTL